MSKIMICFLLFYNSILFGQPTKVKVKGVVCFNKPYYKYNALLMQDTSLSGNRFYNWFNINTKNQQFSYPKKEIKYYAFIIDSSTFLFCEEKLKKSDSSIVYFNCSDDAFQNNISKYIRLYMGFFDENNKKNVVVQFVRPKQFKKYQQIFECELFLLAQLKNLRYAIIKLE